MLISDDPVAFANVGFQTRPVKNPDVAPYIANKTLLLQTLSGVCHSLAAHPQHVRDELLGHLQRIGMRPIMSHQHPAAQSLLDRMKTVTNGGLRDLRD